LSLNHLQLQPWGLGRQNKPAIEISEKLKFYEKRIFPNFPYFIHFFPIFLKFSPK